MKKILVVVFLVVATSACAMQPIINEDTAQNANKRTQSRIAAASEGDIVAKEKARWDAIKNKDWDALGKMLASDFIDVEDRGVYDKAGSIASLKNYDLSEVTFSDWQMLTIEKDAAARSTPIGASLVWKMLTIDKDAVILTYDVNTKGRYKDEELPPGPCYTAAAYVNRDGQWLNIFYQQTTRVSRLPDVRRGVILLPGATSSPPSGLGKTGPDAVANEKIVWNALRSENYDAFAAWLAPDAIDVEPEGVFDKAGSVKHASWYDASKLELSEWKTVKLDNYSSLVTYLVSSTGASPEQARHATIWVNRNDQWLAVFHQETPLTKPTVTKREVEPPPPPPKPRRRPP